MYKYIIYQTTCVVNQKFYIGKHKTKRVKDGYIGSGFLLRKAIKKYGKENFVTEILHFCKSDEEMTLLEREIVNEDLLKNPLCYNLIVGGSGPTPESIKDRVHSWQVMTDEQKDTQRKSMSATISKVWEDPKHRKKISELTRKRMTENTPDSFKYATKGRVWISNNGNNRLVSKEDAEKLISMGWYYGVKKKPSVTGNKHSLGKTAITNLETNKCKMILSNEVNEYLKSGWRLGTARKILTNLF
jgi:hypothetical protein